VRGPRVLIETLKKEKGPACAGPSLFLGRKHPTEDAMNVTQAGCLVVAEMSHRRCKVSAQKSPAVPEQSGKSEQPIDEDQDYGVKMGCCLLASKTNQDWAPLIGPPNGCSGSLIGIRHAPPDDPEAALPHRASAPASPVSAAPGRPARRPAHALRLKSGVAAVAAAAGPRREASARCG